MQSRRGRAVDDGEAGKKTGALGARFPLGCGDRGQLPPIAARSASINLAGAPPVAGMPRGSTADT